MRNIKKRLVPLLLAAVIGLGSFSGLLLMAPQKAAASGENFSWQNKNSITGKDGHFVGTAFFSRVGTSNDFFSPVPFTTTEGCKLNGTISVKSDKSKGTLTFENQLAGLVVEGCTTDQALASINSHGGDITIGNVGNAGGEPPAGPDTKIVRVKSSVPIGKVFPADSEVIILKRDGTKIRTESNPVYRDGSGTSDPSYSATFTNIALSPSGKENYEACSAALNKCVKFEKRASGDVFGQNVDIRGAGIDETATLAAGEEVCPITEESDLRWIICPLVELGDATIGWMEGIIQWFLYTPTDVIFDGIKDSTAGFRNIGLSLLAIAALVMIVSQAMGIEIFDAYTIKKIMPRLLIAAIGIALAMPLMEFVIGFFNDLGLLIDKIVRASVKSPSGATSASFGPLGGGVGVFVLATAGIAMTGLGILSLMGTIILALLIGLLVLAVRQMVIMVCVLFAPIAIAAYILPGTQKLWAFWQNAFMTSLLMFPIVMAFIAAGEALSKLLGGSSSPEMQMLALIVRYAPFFLLPFAFKLAGGLMATVFSLANDSSRGGFDRLKNFRQARTKQSFAQMKAGNRFSDRNFATRGFNRGTSGAAAAGAAGISTGFGLTKRGRQQVREGVAQQRMVAAQNDIMKHPNWGTINENDAALHAATYNSAAAAVKGLQRSKADGGRGMSEQDATAAAAAAQQSIGFGRSQAIAAAQQLATTGTGYDDMRDQARTIARASGGNRSTASAIAGYNNFISKQKGRSDLAPGAGALIGLAQTEMTGTAPSDAEYAKATFDATGSTDAMTTMRNKKLGFENTMEGLKHGLQVDPAAAEARTHDLINTLSYGPQPNQELLEKFVRESGNTILVSHLDSALEMQRTGRGGQQQPPQSNPNGPQPPPTPPTPTAP